MQTPSSALPKIGIHPKDTNATKLINTFKSAYRPYLRQVNLNDDEYPDLVYIGPIAAFMGKGLEGFTTVLYLQTSKGDFRELARYSGNLYEINQHSLSNNKELIIIDEGCCGDVVFQYKRLLLLHRGEEIIIQPAETIEFIEDESIPSQVEFKKRFKITKAQYHLRSSPTIQSAQNIIQSFTTADYGIAVAAKTDQTGRVWWYVIMRCASDFNCRTATDEVISYAGWMSSRYLVELE